MKRSTSAGGSSSSDPFANTPLTGDRESTSIAFTKGPVWLPPAGLFAVRRPAPGARIPGRGRGSLPSSSFLHESGNGALGAPLLFSRDRDRAIASPGLHAEQTRQILRCSFVHGLQ